MAMNWACLCDCPFPPPRPPPLPITPTSHTSLPSRLQDKRKLQTRKLSQEFSNVLHSFEQVQKTIGQKVCSG